MQRFMPFAQEWVSMATLVCAHGTTILINREPSELVAESIFCAIQVRIWTIIIIIKLSVVSSISKTYTAGSSAT